MAKKQQKYEYVTDFSLFDRDHFEIVKGISAIIYVLVYLAVSYLDIQWAEPFLGLSAAICLLCSGYGVSTSFVRKDGLQHYWENKAVKIWIPSLVAVVIEALAVGNNAVSWIGNNPMALRGWFLYLLMAEYAVFWVIFHYVENKNSRLVLLFIAAIAGFFLVSDIRYAQLMHCFPLGVLVSQLNWRNTLKSLSALKKLGLCAILLALAVGGFFLQGMFSGYLQWAFSAICWTFGAAALILGIYYLRGLDIFGIFAPVGRIGYALYLLTPAVLYLLRRWMTGYQMLAVLAALVVICALYSWLREQLIYFNKKMRHRKQSRLKGMM